MRLLVLLLALGCHPDRTWLRVCPVGEGFIYEPSCPRPSTIKWPTMPLTVYAEAAYYDTVAEACAFWNVQLGAKAFAMTYDPAADVIVGLVLRTGRLAASTSHSFEGGHLRAFVDLHRPVDIYDALPVFAHELGHVLGLDHDSAEGSVMYPEAFERPYVVTGADRDALRGRYFR
jgi:hypothetical protein